MGAICRGSELPKPAAASDSLISDGRYGGNLPHLQMPLPFLYPINARGFGTHDAARKGIEAMDSLGKDDNGIGRLGRVQRSNSDRQAQVLALSKFAQLRGVAQRADSSRRRAAQVVLPSLRRQAPIWERQDTSVPKQCSLQVSLSTPFRTELRTNDSVNFSSWQRWLQLLHTAVVLLS